MKLIHAPFSIAILTLPITFFIVGCERESNTPSPIASNSTEKNLIFHDYATYLANTNKLIQIITASEQTQENRLKQIVELLQDSPEWPLHDRLELIRYLDKINLIELGYDDQGLTTLASSLLGDLPKLVEGRDLMNFVNTVKHKKFKTVLLDSLTGFVSISNPRPVVYTNLLENLSSSEDRKHFLSSAISTTSNLPVETREETVKILAAQINKEIDPDPNLAKMLGVTLFTSLKEYPIPDQNITDVVEISNMFRSSPALFEAYVSGFLMFYLENNGVEATQWLLKQDNDWIGYGAPTVAEYIIRTDKEAGLEWLKRAYPNAKIQEATNFTIRELNE